MATDPEAKQSAPKPPLPAFPEPTPPAGPPGSTLLPLPVPLQPQEHSATTTMPAEVQEVKKFAASVLAENATNLQNSSQYLHNSYIILLVMYCALFAVGVATAVAAIIKGVSAKDASEAIPTLIFAGLSAASFFTLFIIRPLESLERNTIFSSWVVAALNTYWTQLMYLENPETVRTDLEAITKDLVDTLSQLSDKYATAIGKYAPLSGAASNPTGNATRSTTGGSDGMSPRS